MDGWKEQLELERDELALKVRLIARFLHNKHMLNEIDEQQVKLLKLQYGSMSSYLYFLNARIDCLS